MVGYFNKFHLLKPINLTPTLFFHIIKPKKRGIIMTDYTSIRIKKEIAEKIQLIKIQNNCKSLNETLEQLIPRTVNENYEFIKEQPIFTINNTPITFTDLKNNNTGKTWGNEKQNATIVFKDKQGAFIRFNDEDEVFLEYYHFI